MDYCVQLDCVGVEFIDQSGYNVITSAPNTSENQVNPDQKRVFDFERIRTEVKAQRKDAWPWLSTEADQLPALDIYTRCREQAAYNILGPRSHVNTNNNIQAWKSRATAHEDDDWLIDCISMGFPMQYRGPPLHNGFTSNHPSAVNFKNHISDYIEYEIGLNAIVGPFKEPPFKPWANIAPLMTREKADKESRRIIVDLSYPPGCGPNAYITKNEVFGELVNHALPTVQDAIRMIVSFDFDVVLGSIDVARAYRNFLLDPIDWPLACIYHDGGYYIDTRMPFGSRISSVYMQRIAHFIQRALVRSGVVSIIYLDDILTVCRKHDSPEEKFKTVLDLLEELGLPIAWNKVVSPSRVTKFLGIIIDLHNREIRIPDDKISNFATLARQTVGKTYISTKTAQSIAGHINHLSKAVRPARLFMNRILEVMREAGGRRIRIDDRFRADLSWFIKFLEDFNGRSLIVQESPVFVIEADSCLTGGGARMDQLCYAIVYPSSIAESMHISQLEALNCIVAARVFLSDKANVCVRIICDNLGAITSLATGRGRDPVITAISRAFWFFAAVSNILFVFTHAPGHTMQVADALSRRHLSPYDAEVANRVVEDNGLCVLDVDLTKHDYFELM